MATKKLQLAGVRLVNEEDYGKSAYEIALDNGFKGTEAEWVESLKGEPGDPGYVPVKGVDYYTTAERNELRRDMVEDLVPEIENYLADYTRITFVKGALANGTTQSASNNRLRTDYISVDGVIPIAGIKCLDSKYRFYVYYYNSEKTKIGDTKTYTNNKSGWVASWKLSTALEQCPNISYVRIVASKTDDTNLTAADVYSIIVLQLSASEHIKQITCRTLHMPYLYLVGDVSDMTKDNAVPLNYEFFNTGTHAPTLKGTCTCKWQGSSSVRRDYPKRNYTIKFDEAVTFNEKWGSQKKYCLKANWVDPSACRNIVGARLWGKVVEQRENQIDPAAFERSPNYGAIDGFPCIVVINGNFTGLYTFNVPKDGWMFGMGFGETEFVVAGKTNESAQTCGFRKPVRFEPYSSGVVDFEIEYKPDGVDDETVKTSFTAFHDAIRTVTSESGWENNVEEYFDIDSAIDYYIFICCIGGYDNLSNNILYATYDGVKWFMSAYDMDTAFGAQVYGESWYEVKTDRTQFLEARSMHRIFALIYDRNKEALKARYKELRSTVLSNENVWLCFNNYVNGIPRTAYNLDAERYPTMLATSSANVATYMDYYRMHCDYLDKEIDAL